MSVKVIKIMSDNLIEEKQDKEHFLDTSVVRSLLLATQIYQNYLDSLLGKQQLYISSYVRMEIKRSYLINLISFYFILRLDAISTIGDAISLWSNKFHMLRVEGCFTVYTSIFYRLSI
jgi:hypothetical protein